MKTKAMNLMKALGYVRVSNPEQKGVSLEAQEARIRAYAVERGLELLTLYREEGVSAKLPLHQRRQGAKLVQMLAKNRAGHVIAVKLDRLFRNAADALRQTEEWDQRSCALHIVDMGGSAMDTASAMGRMFFPLGAAFAEMKRSLISERTKAALSYLKESGQVYCHRTPLGFVRAGRALIHNPVEMAVVNLIQKKRAEGLSLGKIAAHLNATAVPTKRGGRWHAVTIQNVLRIHS